MKTIRLEGKWTLSNRRGDVTVDATLPGDTHSALLRAGRMKNPYYGLQEMEALWAGREDWAYEREFSVPAEMLTEHSVFLHLENVDTISSVSINGRPAFRTANAFRRYRVEVKRLLKTGRNSLRIEIRSAEKAAQHEAKKMPYPVPHNWYPLQSPHRNLIRKTQCHAGWDWGPCLMVAGVYGELYLAGVSAARIEHVLVRQKHAGRRVEVEVCCEVISPRGGEAGYEMEFGDHKVSGRLKLRKGMNVLKRGIVLRNPKLWWPNGYGAAHLYDLRVSVAGDVVRKRVGIRKVEVRFEEDRHGLSLAFHVNGVPLFAKGANWVPADALPQRISRKMVGDLLASAVQANMNLIRVWGGGRYESEDFYDCCDEKGLLVWQDFMFACALYPAGKSFLANVRQEAEYQVKRLQHRACLALWCGNNEDIGALTWYEESRRNRDRYLVDYERLNEGVLGDTVRRLDPDRVFWPSSPCGGPGDYSDGWHNDSRGDMHFWNVWHDGKPFEDYLTIKPRFCSEFGYQSFPSIDSIRTYAPREQWNLTSPVMEHHQKNPGGNARILENMTRYFRFPKGFEDFVYLSQFQQGLAIRIAVEHFRRLRPVCMGALYWQLNETWPVCSWGSLNHDGKWKLLHYMARNFFAPLLVCVTQTADGRFEIWCCSDSLKDASGILSIRAMDFQGKVLRREQIRTKIPRLSSKRVKRALISDWAPVPAQAFLFVEWRSGGRICRATHFFRPFKECELARLNLTVRVSAAAEAGAFQVALAADVPAFGVSLDAKGIRGEFDDNVFTLLPGAGHSLKFLAKQRTTLAQFRKSLCVHHLRNTY